MLIDQKKRLVTFLHYAVPATDIIGLLSIFGFILSLLPINLITTEPPTGGDMASHYWTFQILVEQALPNFSIRVVNPGNQLGQPLFLNYFPLPFLVMAAMSTVISLGASFKIGTLLGLIFLPFCVYLCLRLLGNKFPAPLFGAGASLAVLFNESFSMWGGNGLSLLAGQFAHSYSLCFLLLGVGRLAYELRQKLFPWLSAILFAATILSHGYPTLGIPAFFLSFLFFFSARSFSKRFMCCGISGIATIALSLWFLVPFVESQPWTTAFTMKWQSQQMLHEAVPEIFYPLLGIWVVGVLWGVIGVRRGERSWRMNLQQVGFWLLPFVFYVALYFILPFVGLIDVRAIPQAQLFLCISAGHLLGCCLRRLGRIWSWLFALPVLFLAIWWAGIHARNFPNWAEWNYSGWANKPLAKELKEITEKLSGKLDDPRVLFELSAVSAGTGTIRVFELLPHFSHRATLESVYIEGTILAPETLHLQAEVSSRPSCPLSQYKCPMYNVGAAEARLQLMGVSELILVTDEILAQARASDYLEEFNRFGPWYLFRLKTPPDLVEVFRLHPELSKEADWQREFFDWFSRYDGSQPMLLKAETLSDHDASTFKMKELIQDTPWITSSFCNPSVEVGFNQITLSTPCPHKAHVVKFAYHPAWQAESGEDLFLVSPGFLGVIPESEKIVLRFGETFLWKQCNLISLCSALVVLVLGMFSWRVRK